MRALIALACACALAPARAHAQDAAAEAEAPEEDAVPETYPFPLRPRLGGGAFEWQSEDEQFALRLGVRGQFRAVLGVPAGGDVRLGLLIRRARLDVSGYLFGEHNRFELELAFSPDDLDWVEGTGPTFTPLLDYIVVFDYLRDLTLVVGQRKVPFGRERLTSSGELAMVERSIVDSALQLDRDFGVWLRSNDLFGAGFFRYWVGVSSGEGRDALVGDDVDLAYQVRLELLPLGLFDSYTQGDLRRTPVPRLAFGLAYAFLDDSPWIDGFDGTVPEDGGTTDLHAAAFDAIFLWGGLTAQIEMLLRYGTRDPGSEGPVTAPSNGAGGFVQVSYLLPDSYVELAARYAMVRGFGETTSFQDRTELGGALSLYFGGHLFKLQLDYFYLWEVLPSFDQGEHRVRLQLQAAL